MEPKSIIITGTSSGIGNATARTLAQAGHTVFAGMRNIDDKNRRAAKTLRAFGDKSPGQIHTLQMDVTDEDQVNEVARFALETAGRIDVAINSAGFASIGWQEEFTIADFHEVMDVFLYGAQRVYRAVLPSMRARQAGLVINVTTIGSRIAMPMRQGPYTCAKWALEALSERYMQELEPQGIESITVQPGIHPGTNLLPNVHYASDTAVGATYPPYTEDRYYRPWDVGAQIMVMKAAAEGGQPVADRILELIESPPGTRPIRNVVNSSAVIGCAEAEHMNQEFDKVQTSLLDRWLRGDLGTLADGVNPDDLTALGINVDVPFAQ